MSNTHDAINPTETLPPSTTDMVKAWGAFIIAEVSILGADGVAISAEGQHPLAQGATFGLGLIAGGALAIKNSLYLNAPGEA